LFAIRWLLMRRPWSPAIENALMAIVVIGTTHNKSVFDPNQSVSPNLEFAEGNAEGLEQVP